MNEKITIEDYWCAYFGVDHQKINATGTIVVPHEHLKGYNGAWLFKKTNLVILSVPPEYVDEIRTKVVEREPEEKALFSTNYLTYLFGENIEKVIGPTFQGFYDDPTPIVTKSEHIREITFKKNRQEIEALSNSGDAIGWNHSSLNENCKGIFGYFHNGQLVSIANYKMLKGDFGFVGIYTHPAFRSRGFSQKLVQQIAKELTAKGKVILYQTLLSNKASLSVAKKIGFKEYARNVAVRFKVHG